MSLESIERKGTSVTATLIVGVLLIIAVGWCFYKFYEPAWQFDHLEQRARKVITAGALQNWATNLIAEHSTNVWLSFRLSEFGTNYPEELRGLAPRLFHGVEIRQWEDTNQPPSVRVWWGSGRLGHAGFEIGAANFEGHGNKWQPGVYFFKQ